MQPSRQVAVPPLNIALDAREYDILLWACRTFGRRPDVIIGGLITDSLSAAREEHEAGDYTNNIPALSDFFAQAEVRRMERKDAKASFESGVQS